MKFDDISYTKNPEGAYTVTFILNHQRIAEATFPIEALAAEYVGFKLGQLVAKTVTPGPVPETPKPKAAKVNAAPKLGDVPPQPTDPRVGDFEPPKGPQCEAPADQPVIDTSAKVGKEYVTDHSAKVAKEQHVDVSAKVPGVDLTKPLPVRNDFDDEL